MVRGVQPVSVGNMSVVGSCFVVASLMVFRGFLVMFRRVLVMLCCLAVVFRTLMICHCGSPRLRSLLVPLDRVMNALCRNAVDVLNLPGESFV
jgi:hypothetical protein